ncbi:MAG: hypothetical protein FWG15_03815 [Propionibacteriaceae bacterium]|nr:hypothetical protein [Propionibacteriaceae bacterium]
MCVPSGSAHLNHLNPLDLPATSFGVIQGEMRVDLGNISNIWIVRW